jgi:hypothetical protein
MSIFSDPVKAVAAIFLLVVLLASVFVAVWDVIHNLPLPPEVYSILSAGIGYALTSLGFSHASSTISSASETTVNHFIKAQNELGNKQSS